MSVQDINTLQFMSATVLTVLSILMAIVWHQNKHIPGTAYWCLFSITLTIDTMLATFPEIRNMQGFIYLFNINGSYSYFFLMLGCIEFAKLNWNRNLIVALFATCAILNGIGAVIELSDFWRRSIIIGYNTIGLIFSVYAISTLSKASYIIEKYFLLILMVMHLLLHLYWLSLEFQVSNSGETSIGASVTLIYILLIMITIGLLLLSLGRVRQQLEGQRNKGINIRTALTNAVQETHIATKSKSIFLTNMSHELRTPLNIILGFSDALRMGVPGNLNDKQLDFVDNIHTGGKRLLALINDLLSLSNIESGNLEKELEIIDPKEILKIHKPVLDKIGLKYSCTIKYIDDLDDLGNNRVIMARHDWIEQILTALIDNAAKYGTLNGTIWMNVFMPNTKTLRISIRDEGHGIDADQYTNVFKPFNRAGIDSRTVEGTGAGLAIVKGWSRR